MPTSAEQNNPSPQESIYSQTSGESLAQVHEALDAFLADAEVGTVKFAAFSDYVTYKDILYYKDSLIDDADFSEYNANSLSLTSEIREHEVTLGTLNAHILVEKGRTPEYAVANKETDLFF